jgi:hypothetical protein
VIKQDESHRALFEIYPQLIELLLLHIDHSLEAVRLAVLKTIEYLVDLLGCSMQKSLILILLALVRTYPVNNLPQTHEQRKVHSFFDTTHRYEEAKSDFKPPFYSFSDLNLCVQVKDMTALHHSFVQSTKNYYNHIFESLLLLLHSMSPDMLQVVFHEIVAKFVFHDTVSSELRVYLLKFADKIAHICKSSVTLQSQFLDNVVRIMLTPSQPKSKKLD